jgi:hypothetical protein
MICRPHCDEEILYGSRDTFCDNIMRGVRFSGIVEVPLSGYVIRYEECGTYFIKIIDSLIKNVTVIVAATIF